jgi:hypothetical protein
MAACHAMVVCLSNLRNTKKCCVLLIVSLSPLLLSA